jgi:hypothetical protein
MNLFEANCHAEFSKSEKRKGRTGQGTLCLGSTRVWTSLVCLPLSTDSKRPDDSHRSWVFQEEEEPTDTAGRDTSLVFSKRVMNLSMTWLNCTSHIQQFFSHSLICGNIGAPCLIARFRQTTQRKVHSPSLVTSLTDTPSLCVKATVPQ